MKLRSIAGLALASLLTITVMAVVAPEAIEAQRRGGSSRGASPSRGGSSGGASRGSSRGVSRGVSRGSSRSTYRTPSRSSSRSAGRSSTYRSPSRSSLRSTGSRSSSSTPSRSSYTQSRSSSSRSGASRSSGSRSSSYTPSRSSSRASSSRGGSVPRVGVMPEAPRSATSRGGTSRNRVDTSSSYRRGQDPLRISPSRTTASSRSVRSSGSRVSSQSERSATRLRSGNDVRRTASSRATALRNGTARSGTFNRTTSATTPAGRAKNFVSPATQRERRTSLSTRATDYGIRTTHKDYYNGFYSSREVRSLYYTTGEGTTKSTVLSVSPRYRSYGWGVGLGYSTGYGWNASFGYVGNNWAISGSYGYPSYSVYNHTSHWGLSAAAYYPHYGVGVTYSPTRTYLPNGWYTQQAYWRTAGGGIYAETVYRAPCYGWRRGGYHWRSSSLTGYHWRNAYGYRYRVCRPYYYFAPAWYGYWYSPNSYSWGARLEARIDDAYEDGYEQGFDDGRSASPYRDERRRPVISTQKAPEERAYTARFEDLMERAASSFHKGEYDRATELFRDASLAAPDDVHARMSLGHAAFASGRYPLAAYALRRALSEKPALMQEEMDRRQHYTDGAIFDHHLNRVREAWKESPQDGDLAFLVGYNAFFSGEYLEASVALSEAVEIDADDEIAAKLRDVAREKLKSEK